MPEIKQKIAMQGFSSFRGYSHRLGGEERHICCKKGKEIGLELQI